MRAHELRGDELGGPAQHVLTLEGVDHVAHPDPVGALEDAEVDAPSAGGERLDLEVGMGCANLVEEAVDRESLGVHRRAPPSGLLPASTRSRLWSHLT